MLLEAGDIDGGEVVADFAVVGGGPAGLTVAAELVATGADVVVLESGGMPYDRAVRSNAGKAVRDHVAGAQSMTRGTASGEPYFPLRLSRARGLGGSTNALKHHGLRGRPLDPIDFVPRLGTSWPMAYEEFGKYLPAAEGYADMVVTTDHRRGWESAPLELADGPVSGVVVAPFSHGGRGKFADLGRRLGGDSRARVVLGATVVAIATDGIGSVDALEVRSLQRAAFKVRARRYVVAGGAIDNARLLLNSRPVLYLMGEAADHVGRCFMEHLHYVPAVFVPSSPEVGALLDVLVGEVDQPQHWLALDDETVMRENLLRVAYLPVPVLEQSLHPAVPAFGELVRMFPFGPYGLTGRARQTATALRGIHHVAGAAAARLGGQQPGAAYVLSVMAEQPPDPSSRITLSGSTDRLGVPLPHLEWKVGRRDFDDARRSTELLGDQLVAAGAGKVEGLWDRKQERPPVLTGGWHHMGTTRMSDDATVGVVNADCRVHGLDNLYVAGSSVFPTSGYANPTLTLVALAVRLARHLAATPG